MNLTREVISLPSALMQQAPSQCRLSNPVDIEVDKNVIKPAWLHMPCWLVFSRYDVTNRVDLTFQFDQPLADLIDENVHDFRPAVPPSLHQREARR